MNQYDFVQDAFDSGDPIMVMKHGFWGLIDADKKVLAEPKYGFINVFKYGFAAVKKNGLWGFVNEEGKEIVSPKYKRVDSFTKKEIAVVCSEKGYNIIDKNGNELLLQNYPKLKIMSDYIVFVCDNNNFWHVYNIETKTLIKLQYIIDFDESEPYYIVENSKYNKGLLDSDGNTVIECKYKSIEHLKWGIYIVYDNSDDCFVYNAENNSLNYVGHVEILDIVDFKDNFYLTYEDEHGKIRFIETTNYMTVLNKYCDEIIENLYGSLKVRIDDKFGYLYL